MIYINSKCLPVTFIQAAILKIKYRSDHYLRLRKAKARVSDAGIWFVDIPRSSSTSIRCALGAKFGFPYGKEKVFEKDYSSSQIFADHQTALEASNLLGDRLWSKLIKFTIVRNPWDRFYSMYKYQLRAHHIHPTLDFLSYTKAFYDFKYHNISWSFLSDERLFRSQCEFISDLDGALDSSIHLIRYENRNKALRDFLRKIHLHLDTDLRLQAGADSLSYREAYSEDTKEMIEKLYSDDIHKLGYSF